MRHTIHPPRFPENLPALAAAQLWRLHDWVQRKVDARLALLEGAVPPTIGFHIRGGDKGEEDVLRVKMLPTPSLMHAHGSSCLGRGAADMSCPLQLAAPPLHMPVWQGYPFIYQYRTLISTKQVHVTLSCCGRRSGRARRPPTTSVRWARTGRGSGCASDVRYLLLAVQHPAAACSTPVPG